MKAVIIAGAAIVVAVMGLFRLLWLSVPYEAWIEYERVRRNRKRTCNTCKHQPPCKTFFPRKCSALKMIEPEALKTAACKMYQKREGKE